MKVLYIGDKINNPSGGAEVVNQRNQKLLEGIVGKENLVYIPPHVRNLCAKFVFGVTGKFLKMVGNALSDGAFTHVFVSQSLLGRVVKYVAGKFPQIKVVTFFHNIEVDYARDFLKAQGLKKAPFFWAAKLWERCSVRYSDKLITLNGRDSRRLSEVYGKQSDLELPTSFEDNFDADKCTAATSSASNAIDYLFVGVAFFPNIQGVQWFIDQVLPNVSGDFYVVGKGMDTVAFKNLSERIHIYGYVPDLSDFYYRAKMVVSPIFSGAGMKTKTAEALMYGKTIIGTTEAFEGYDMDERCMLLADNRQAFIDSIGRMGAKHDCFNAFSRTLFLNKYCMQNLQPELKKVL